MVISIVKYIPFVKKFKMFQLKNFQNKQTFKAIFSKKSVGASQSVKPPATDTSDSNVHSLFVSSMVNNVTSFIIGFIISGFSALA